MPSIPIGERLNRQIQRATWDSEVLALENQILKLETRRALVECEQARQEDMWEVLDELYGFHEDTHCRYWRL